MHKQHVLSKLTFWTYLQATDKSNPAVFVCLFFPSSLPKTPDTLSELHQSPHLSRCWSKCTPSRRHHFIFLSNIENCPERFCVQEFLKGKDETLSQQTSPYVMFKWPPSFQMICFTSSEWPLSCILNFGSERNEIRVQFDRIDMRRLCDFTPPAEGKLTLARDDTESQSKFYLRKVNGKWVNAHGRLIHIDRRCGTLICKCDEVDSISVLRKVF